MLITVIKRNWSNMWYDANKIRNAISKANESCENQEDRVTVSQIDDIIEKVEKKFEYQEIISIEKIQDIIEAELLKLWKINLAKKYIEYRYTRELKRKNETEESILQLINRNNEEVANENSNKNAMLNSTQRDLIAWEVSKDLSKRYLLPEDIKEAHEKWILHMHDLDYLIQAWMFNCCLVNIKDMFENWTVINWKMIETPKSFQVACTVMTQIMASVASWQYWWQSVNIKHLWKYLFNTKQKYERKFKEEFWNKLDDETITKLVQARVKDELSSWVQTIQYQINTLYTSNWQSPFVTLFLELDPEDPYIEETAQIIEEILKQRITWIKNEKWVYITPAFPKLVYVLDEHNALKWWKYDYITKLAAECSAKRMYPDYISAKKMREHYEWNVFSPMWCRSFLSTWKDQDWKYKFEWRFNQWVVTLNLPQIAILAQWNEEKFFELLEERLNLVFKALLIRHERLKWAISDISPIHWQYWAIARLQKWEKIDPLLKDWYSTISLWYIWVYEMTYLMKWVSHTTEEWKQFALQVMKKLQKTAEQWKKETWIWFWLYWTPAESLWYRFAKLDEKQFWKIKNVTDKWYYTNSYHVDVREKIDAIEKLSFESEFQALSSWWAISYIEVPNMKNNLEALETLIKFIYDNIQYAEFNTKSDYCHVCWFDWEIKINEQWQWECPQCWNKDHSKMNVVRRTCWYLWENFWNKWKTQEIWCRVLHI